MPGQWCVIITIGSIINIGGKRKKIKNIFYLLLVV